MKMSSPDRVESSRLPGEGAAPGMLGAGAGRPAVRGRGSPPGPAGRPVILGHRRGRGGGSVPTRGGAAVGAGGVAGLQHEVRARRRLGREDGGVVQDNEAAIEEVAQLDPTAGIGAVVGPRGDLDPARPEVNGIVAGYLARDRKSTRLNSSHSSI